MGVALQGKPCNYFWNLGFGISPRDWIDFLSRLRRYRKSAMGVALQGKQIKRFAFIVFSFAPKLKQAWLICK
jgi:hypothetical protein